MVLFVAVLIAAIALHSVVTYGVASDLNIPWLIKETLKLIALVILFACLITLFQLRELWLPPRAVVATILLAVIPLIILISHLEPFRITRTVYVVALIGFIFLIALHEEWQNSRSTVSPFSVFASLLGYSRSCFKARHPLEHLPRRSSGYSSLDVSTKHCQ